MAKRGRPTKLNTELMKELVRIVREGSYIETACALVGIDKKSLYTWLEKGRQESDEQCVDFLHAIEKASAEAEHEAQRIVRTGKPGWVAVATWLERRFPGRWGRRKAIEA